MTETFPVPDRLSGDAKRALRHWNRCGSDDAPRSVEYGAVEEIDGEIVSQSGARGSERLGEINGQRSSRFQQGHQSLHHKGLVRVGGAASYHHLDIRRALACVPDSHSPSLNSTILAQTYPVSPGDTALGQRRDRG